jgi:hypothetical protein
MSETKTKLVELVGGAADGKCIRIPSYATTIVAPTWDNKVYRELVYTQEAASPQRYKYQTG